MFVADEDRKLMSAIHKIYFEDINLLDDKKKANQEISFIMNRYKEYYNAYNDKAGAEQSLLEAVIAKDILQKSKPEFSLAFPVATDVILLIRQLQELILDKCELVNS